LCGEALYSFEEVENLSVKQTHLFFYIPTVLHHHPKMSVGGDGGGGGLFTHVFTSPKFREDF
jgi:hypothetical protein